MSDVAALGPADIAGRLDRLPISRFHRRLLMALAFGFFFELADLNTFSYAAPGLRDSLGLSVDDIALITSGGFFGMFVGAAGGGRLGDVLGRRRTLLVSVAWYSVWSLANAAAWSVGSLLAARLLTGIGLGAMTVIAITYLSEMVPSEKRGRMQSAVLAAGLLGIPVMAFIARGVVPISDDSWRLVFLFGGLGFVALALIRRLPESPRWLLEHRGGDAAEATLRAIEADVEADAGPLPEPAEAAPAFETQRGIGELFQGPLRSRSTMLLAAWIFQTLGFYGFVSWVPTLLADHGFSLDKSLGFAALTTLGAVPGALLAWPLSDRFGRKAPIIVVAGVVAACGLGYGLTFDAVAIVGFGFLVACFIQTFAALLYAYTPELYPTPLRNTGSGLCYGVGRLSNIGGPFLVSAIYGGAGYAWVFVYIAGCWALVAVAVAVLGPRSGGAVLEELQETGDHPAVDPGPAPSGAGPRHPAPSPG
jgi:putative MFS transporter